MDDYEGIKQHAQAAIKLLEEAIAACDTSFAQQLAKDEAIDFKLDKAFGEVLTAMDNIPKYKHLASQPENSDNS